MNETQRLEKLEAVQMNLFALSRQQEQLRLQFRKLQKSRSELSKKIVHLRLTVRRLLPPDMKKCRKCGVEMRSDEFFYPCDRYVDGREPYCKFCKVDIAKARNAA